MSSVTIKNIKMNTVDKALKEFSFSRKERFIRIDTSNYTFVLDISPTANCQLSSIGGFDSFIEIKNQLELSPTQAFELLKRIIYAHVNKPLLLIDVQDEYLKETLEIFSASSLLINSPYTSSNGHYMNLLLINLYIK